MSEGQLDYRGFGGFVIREEGCVEELGGCSEQEFCFGAAGDVYLAGFVNGNGIGWGLQ